MRVRRFGFEISHSTPTLLHEQSDSSSFCCLLKVATQIHSGRIVWVSGGVPGVHDKKILTQCGLLNQLLPGEKGLADKGYVGRDIEDRITTPFKGALTSDQEAFNRALSTIRITVERVNGLIKSFGILSQSFRHDIELHSMLFGVICDLVNLRLKIFPLTHRVHPLLQSRSVHLYRIM